MTIIFSAACFIVSYALPPCHATHFSRFNADYDRGLHGGGRIDSLPAAAGTSSNVPMSATKEIIMQIPPRLEIIWQASIDDDYITNADMRRCTPHYACCLPRPPRTIATVDAARTAATMGISYFVL